jgi:hypothetical protein
VHGLDDVGANSEIAKRRFSVGHPGNAPRLREGPFVREVGLTGEHARRFTGPGYAIALEIANVRGRVVDRGPR